MNELEKVEKLRERANVSYEEAREALAQCNGDLLDAMVMLERQGKVKGPQQSSYSTSYEEQKQYVSVIDKVEESKGNAKTLWQRIKSICAMLWQKGNDNFFCVSKNEELSFKMPAWVFVVITLCAWEITLWVMIIALFFGYKYSFIGKDKLGEVNHVFDKASEFAEQVKNEFKS